MNTHDSTLSSTMMTEIIFKKMPLLTDREIYREKKTTQKTLEKIFDLVLFVLRSISF